jgi:hypothetical protein
MLLLLLVIFIIRMSALLTPPSSPPNHISALPNPIIEGICDKKEVSRITLEFAKYYWPRHFERVAVDPASFLDKIFTDYAEYSVDVLGQWLSLDLDASKLSTVYRLYKACLNYGVKAGSPLKAAEAERFQGVLARLELISDTDDQVRLPTQPRVQETIIRHRRLRSERLARAISMDTIVNTSPRPPSVESITPPPIDKSVKLPSEEDSPQSASLVVEGTSDVDVFEL